MLTCSDKDELSIRVLTSLQYRGIYVGHCVFGDIYRRLRVGHYNLIQGLLDDEDNKSDPEYAKQNVESAIDYIQDAATAGHLFGSGSDWCYAHSKYCPFEPDSVRMCSCNCNFPGEPNTPINIEDSSEDSEADETAEKGGVIGKSDTLQSDDDRINTPDAKRFRGSESLSSDQLPSAKKVNKQVPVGFVMSSCCQDSSLCYTMVYAIYT